MVLQGVNSLDAGHKVSWRLVTDWHHTDINQLCRLNDAAFHPSPEVINNVGVLFDVSKNFIARIQCDDILLPQYISIDIAGAVVKIIGDENAATMLGISYGMSGLSLSSLDRIKKCFHIKRVDEYDLRRASAP